MCINVYFTSDSPLNSTVVDNDSGHPLYEISTSHKPMSPGQSVWSTTTIRELEAGPKGDAEDIAVWERSANNWNQDRVTHHGETRMLGEWLRKKDVLSRTRTFAGPDGEEYAWKQKVGLHNTFKLVNLETHHTVALSHTGHGQSLFSGSSPRTLSLDIEPDAAAFLDAILLSFVILEQSRRERNKGRTAVMGRIDSWAGIGNHFN